MKCERSRLCCKAINFKLTFTEKAPRDGFSNYSTSLAALCTSEYPIIPRLVDDLLNTQARDGSFGDTISNMLNEGHVFYNPLANFLKLLFYSDNRRDGSYTLLPD